MLVTEVMVCVVDAFVGREVFSDMVTEKVLM